MFQDLPAKARQESVMSKIQELKTHLADVVHLQHAAAILGWDQQTYMPPGGAEARAEQLATLSRLAHEMFIADATGKLLQEAAAEVASADYDSDDAALVLVEQNDYYLATRPHNDARSRSVGQSPPGERFRQLRAHARQDLRPDAPAGRSPGL